MPKRAAVESLAPVLRPVRPITRHTKSDNLSCSWCCSEISPTADHVVLSPCQCTVCPKCLLHELAPRGRNDAQCQCCGSPICSHQYFESRLAQLPKAEYHEPQTEPQIDDKLWLQQPIKCLTLSYIKQKELTPDTAYECTVLYGVRLSYNGSGVAQFEMQRCIVPLTIVSGTTLSRSICRGIQQFGVFLEKTITQRSITPYDQAEALSPQRFVAKKLDSPTPLLSLLFGLATGNGVIDESTIRQPISDPINQTLSSKAIASKSQSQFIAIAGAADMLLRSIANNPCEFQLMVNRVFQMEKLSRNARDFASIIRISASRALTQANLCKEVVAQMAKQIEITPDCIHVIIVDNLGFNDKANHDPTKIGTLQTTQIIDIVISVDMLKAEGILDEDGKLLLSATPSNTHENLQREEGAAVRLVAVSQVAKDLLTECVAEAMMTAASDYLKGNVVIGKRRARSGRFISMQTKGELLSNTPIADMHPEDVEAVIAAEATEAPSTLHHQYYHQPNMICQIVKRDLSRATTIAWIADYLVAVQEKAKITREAKLLELDANDDESTENDTTADPPLLMDIVGSFVVCDGQPAANFDRIFAADAQSEVRRYTNIDYMIGGFHTILKLHNAIGKLFDLIFKIFYSKYRRTSKRIEYIQFPGDPRQLEKEFVEFLQSIYGSAAVYFHLKFERAPSANELNDFMLERGKKYPIVALIILYTRYAEVAKMMKMSERKKPRGCMKLFIATLEFALPLFAMTHKTDYVRLISSFKKKWECASPLLRAVYERFLFTQVGPTGIPMMSDLYMEMMNRKTRADCGKRVYKGLEERIEQSLYMNAVERQEDGNIIEQLRTGGQADKMSRSETHVTTTPSSPILALYDFIHNKARFFDPDSPPIIGHDTETNLPVYAEEGGYEMQVGEHMNPEILYFCVAGTERAERYFELYHIDQDNAVSRSEEDVSLESIPLSAGDLTKLKSKYVETKVSVTHSVLSKLMNKEQLLNAIKDVHFTLTFDLDQDEELPRGLNSKKKDALIELLIKYRKQYFRLDKEAKAHIEEVTAREFDEDHQAELSIDQVLDLDIYKLSEHVMSKQRYSTPVVL